MESYSDNSRAFLSHPQYGLSLVIVSHSIHSILPFLDNDSSGIETSASSDRYGSASQEVAANAKKEALRGESNAAEFGGGGSSSGVGVNNIDRMHTLGAATAGGGATEERRESCVEERSKAYFVGGKLEYCICRKPDINRFMIGKPYSKAIKNWT